MPQSAQIPHTGRLLRILRVPGNPQKVTFKTTLHSAALKSTQGDPQSEYSWAFGSQNDEIICHWSPKWKQSSRCSENPPEHLGQTPTLMKKALLILSACPSPTFSVPEACKHQKRRLQSSNWAPKKPNNDPRYHQKSLLLASLGNLKGQGGIGMAQKTQWHQNVTKFQQKSPEDNVKFIIGATKFSH